jgi:ribosome-associated protein
MNKNSMDAAVKMAEPQAVVIPESELEITHVRSSGKGGQNVNKRDTKAVVRFNIVDSDTLTNEQKDLILARLEHRINENGELIVTAQEERSQKQNTESAIRKLNNLINKSLEREAERIATVPTESAKDRRIREKEERGRLKQLRQKITGQGED